MKTIIITAALLAASIAGSASADVLLHSTPLSAKFVPHEQGASQQHGQRGYWFYGHSTDIKYLPGDGDEVLLKLHGFQGIRLVGLPPFVREVSTADGRQLRGIPQPGTYTVQLWRDGKHISTLDMTMRFIPR